MNEIQINWPGAKAHVFDKIDSTNLEAIRLGHDGAPEGTLVVAEQQTEGRGRRGRSWVSPVGTGIYMTLLQRPTLSVDLARILTPVAAYVICRIVRDLGMDARIKWPNDVVIGDKKICGILTEMQISAGEYFIVTGIGINVGNREFTGDAPHGTSLYLASGKEFAREPIIEAFMKEYEVFYREVNRAGSLDPILEGYNALLVNRDRQVRVLEPGREWNGTARGMERDGALLVTDANGMDHRIDAGEVSVRGVYGYTQ